MTDPDRDPSVDLAFTKLTEEIHRADNEYAKLLALRKCAQVLYQCSAGEDAFDDLKEMGHVIGVSDECMGMIVERELCVAHFGWPPPTSLEMGRPTPQTVVEALLYSLRQGIGVMEQLANQARLSACDSAAMKQIFARLKEQGWSERNLDILARQRAACDKRILARSGRIAQKHGGKGRDGSETQKASARQRA